MDKIGQIQPISTASALAYGGITPGTAEDYVLSTTRYGGMTKSIETVKDKEDNSKHKVVFPNICTKLKLIEKKDCVLVDLRLETEDGTYSSRQFAIGRVVLSAFFPKIFPNQTVEHLDGNFRNNSPENLVNCRKWINNAHAHSRVNHAYCKLRDGTESGTSINFTMPKQFVVFVFLVGFSTYYYGHSI